MRDVVIAAGKTHSGWYFGGGLAGQSASQLGATVIRQLLTDTGVTSEHVDEVILGQVLTAGVGQNPARQASIGGGLTEAVPAMTINKVCGSGLKGPAPGDPGDPLRRCGAGDRRWPGKHEPGAPRAAEQP